jgi:coenzyme F420-reducing hydrogenase beta subunit
MSCRCVVLCRCAAASHVSILPNCPCRFTPKPLVARTAADIIAARGVKPTLSPNLEVLATVEALAGTVKRLLFIGVGCQVSSRVHKTRLHCAACI